MTSILRRSQPQPAKPKHRDPDATRVVFTGRDEGNAELTAMMDSLAADATSARLFDLEREHGDLAALHAELIGQMLANAPEGWCGPDPATSGLSYLRALEAACDRYGIDRRPPWEQPTSSEAPRIFDALAARSAYLFDPTAPVPVASVAGTGGSGPGEPEAGAAPVAPEPSPGPADEASEDEPQAEPDCAEGES